MALSGVDISHWQAGVDYPTLASGQAFVIMKASENLKMDPAYNQHRQGLDGLIPLGFYHYLIFSSNQDQNAAMQDGAAQADFYAATVGPLAGYLPPVVDVEQTDNPQANWPNSVATLSGFLNRLSAAYDTRAAIVYTSKGDWQAVTSDDNSFGASTLLWVASYTTAASPTMPNGGWGSYVIWQNSATGNVAGVNGNVDIDVFSGDAADLVTLTQVAGQPRLSRVIPATGAPATNVRLIGSGFAPGCQVDFGSTPAADVAVVSASTADVVVPSPAEPASVIVTITTAQGTSPDQIGFTYAVAGPVVTAVAPASGSAGGGDTVVITGTGFTGATDVSFGPASAAAMNVDADTQITATSPPGTGTVDVTVTTPAGTSPATTTDQFTYAVAGP
jgi:GH25 family lysozyme M1 (1,4-beta-N-acetylmuramidase)